MSATPYRDEAAAVRPQSSIGDRFERLPFTGYQRKLVYVLALCFLVDAVDLGLLSYLLAPMSADLGLSQAQAGFAASSVFIGMAVGATVAGAVADRIGRRAVLVSSMFLWGTASLLTAFSWDLSSFVVLRMITGIGLGAELPVAFTLLAELVPAARRARLTSWIMVIGTAGLALFNMLAWLAITAVGPDLGWRVMFAVMFAVAGLAMFVRRNFPESPRWYESRGEHGRADEVMSRIERDVERAHGAPLPEAVPGAARSTTGVRSGGSEQRRLLALFSRSNVRGTVLGWSMWLVLLFPYYGINTWVGKLLVDRGMSVSSSIAAGALMGLGALPAIFAAGQLMDRVGRKVTLVASLVLVAAGALLYGSATGFWAVVAFGAVMQMGLQCVGTSLNTYTPELFPIALRATGVGTSQTLGRIAAIIAPMMVPVIVVLWGYTGAFVVFSALFALGAVLVVAFGPESRSRTLEELVH